MDFKDLELSNELKKGLNEMGFITLTPIQEKAIPSIIDGQDIIGESQTGTGKTAAYSLPILDKIDKNLKKVQAIILCPTRELAIQVVGEIRKFSKYEKDIKSMAIYGGESIEKQIKPLKNGVQIVVGTPGRVMDHMRRKTLKMDAVTMVVLDEADEMLNMGFEEDINTIISEIPEGRQTILFSATMNKRILGVAKKYLNEPTKVKIPKKELTVDKIEQISIELKQSMKNEALSRIIDFNDPKKAVIFCNTKRKVEELTDNLRNRGYVVESLYGDVKQEQRERIMKKFKTGNYQLLVATDVMARGIDVDDLELVVNYDIPQEEEYYVHRIGRTGRNGKTGKAYTFVVGKERLKLESIERFAKTQINPGLIPSDSEMLEVRKNNFIAKLQKEMDEVTATKNPILDDIYDKLSEQNTPEEILKTLLALYAGKDLNLKAMPKLDLEKTTDSKKSKKDDKKKMRFFLSLGKKDSIKAKDILGSVTSNTIISGSEIGKIDVLDKFSFIEIPSKYESDFLSGMSGKKVKGIDVRIEVANRK